MSDFFDNDNKTTNNQSNGEYSYSRNEINQGESYYQWSPYEDKNKKNSQKKEKGFGAKVARAAVIALVFGLVAGITFSSVVYVAGKFTGENVAAITETQDESKTEVKSVEKTESGSVSATPTSTTTVLDVSSTVENVMPAIVQVTNVGLTTYQSFFGTYQQESTSCGSGIIINQDDDNIYIATNNHVVSGAETLTITFCDDAAVEGKIKGTDSSCDLAVVSVAIDDISDDTLGKIKVATIGDSDSAVVGNGCIVIGNALGYGQSVTTGVISALNREVQLQDDQGNVITNTLIQTDAAVNPGNSGGALLNTSGEVIGIVSAKLLETSVEGMGYAIPISYASSIIQQMVDKDVVSDFEASYLGIGGKDAAANAVTEGSPAGVYVAQVVDESAAASAGIEVGDIITNFNGRKVTSMSTIQNILQYISAGETVDITVAKKSDNYKEVTYQVTLTHKYTEIQ